MEFAHKSILLNEVIESLNIKTDGFYADGTLGGGGHSFEIASRLSENGKLIGIDQDEASKPRENGCKPSPTKALLRLSVTITAT